MDKLQEVNDYIEKMKMKKVIGCIIGFLGVIIVNLNGGSLDMAFNLLGDGFILISAFACAMSAVVIKIYGKTEDPVMLSGYQFLIGGLIMSVAGVALGGRIHMSSMQGLILLLYMAFISAGAYTIWGILLKYNPVSKVTVFGFTNPVFGVILSALILGEGGAFTIRSMVALILVSIGIIVVNK